MTLAESANKFAQNGRGFPDGWQQVALEKIARIFAGSSAPQGKDSFSESGAPFVRVSDLSNCNAAGVLENTRDHLSEKAVAECTLVKASKGAVLFPKSGAAIATNRRTVLGMDAYIVGHLFALEANPEAVTMEWLYFAMRQIDMMEHSDNVGYPSLKKSAVEKITIPLPPIAEQKRIVAVLNRKMAAVEKARAAALARVEAAQSLPAAWLREVFFFGAEGLPQGWRLVALADICEVKRGQPLTRKETVAGDIPVIAGGQAPAYYHAQANRDGEVITVSGSGAYAGFVNFFDRPIFASDCSTVQAKTKDALMRYVYLAMKSMQSEIYALGIGSAQPHVYAKDVAKITIPLPPIAEQKRIVAVLNRKMAAVEKAREAAEVQLEAVTALPAALLREAFSGAL